MLKKRHLSNIMLRLFAKHNAYLFTSHKHLKDDSMHLIADLCKKRAIN